MSTRDHDVEEFAALLRRLKARTDRSYGALARRVNMNTSTLHRYCAGDAVPLEFAPVERFAALCGATAAERLELHRLWILAVEARQRPRTPGPPENREPGENPEAGVDGGGAVMDRVGAGGVAVDGAGAGGVAVDGAGSGEADARGADTDGTAAGTAGPDGPATDKAAAAGKADTDGATAGGDVTDEADADETAAGKAGTDEAGVDGPSTHKTGTDEAGVDRPGSDGARAGKPGAVGAGVDEAGAEAPGSESSGSEASGSAELSAAGGLVSGSGGAGRRPRQRRRIALTLAAVSALLVTLGALVSLPGDRPSDDASDIVGPSPAPTAKATSEDARKRPSTSPSPSRPGPSPSAGATGKAAGAPGKSGAPSKGAKPKGSGSGAVPLTWTANSHVWQNGCSHDYVIRKDPEQVPPPPAAQDAGTWAASQDAVHGRQTSVQISVQGRTSTAVVLTALRVRVVGRTAPVAGTVYAMDQGCGGSLTPRSFAVDLDKDRPIARSVPGNDEGTPIPAVRMPYRVSDKDPEVLLVNATTETCGCSWYLELDWSSEGRTGTTRVDDHGSPFRTSAIEGLPRYWYGSDDSERRWVPAVE
ncbi:helix-turn-helix domain-containing protein [Streptomyces sp. CWNU-52B]|uniref:helix-turn-helix domain-containing protein n=1 Tax=unclassified Streptomyces TaxID=2593676 RepID=UPI0039BED60F